MNIHRYIYNFLVYYMFIHTNLEHVTSYAIGDNLDPCAKAFIIIVNKYGQSFIRLATSNC
jgi:hypothetical protein